MGFLEKAKKKLQELTGAAKEAVSGAGEKVEEKAETAGVVTAESKAAATVEKVKEEQGIFDKIQNFFTMGYGTKEDLRELDRKLRDGFYSDFKVMRHRWEEIYLEALEAKVKNKDDYKKVIQVMDRVGEKINRADYGYAGLFDRKGSIREQELAKIFNYDRNLSEQIADLKKSVEEIHSLVEAENWSEVSPKVRMVKQTLLEIEEKWDNREKEFRPLEAD